MIAQRRLPTSRASARCNTIPIRRSRCPTPQRLRTLTQKCHHRRTPLALINGVIAPSSRRIPALPRPVHGDVDMASIQTAFPELEGVSAQFFRDQLPSFAPSMLAGLTNLRIPAVPRSSSLPAQLELPASENAAGTPPTHILALHSSAPAAPGTTKKVTLIPTHQLILAAHCACLPALPTAASASTLPVVPLRLPCPEAFPLLQAYLYNKDRHIILSAAAAGPLTRRVALVHGLWQDACALGVVDAQLYDLLDICWVGAIEQAEV